MRRAGGIYFLDGPGEAYELVLDVEAIERLIIPGPIIFLDIDLKSCLPLPSL